MYLKVVVTFLTLMFSTALFSQKTVKICEEYIYHAPENVSLEQARQTALERAKIEALAKEFGTTVSQRNATVVKNENGRSDVSLISLGGSEVKGEWLETTKGPDYKVSYEGDMLTVRVSVCGKAREITGARVDFTAKVLKNGTDAKFESDKFHNGDAIYLLFRSPTSGYLAVYLIDETQTAYCLLPYLNTPTGQTKINAGKDYVFFSEKHADRAEAMTTDEYELTTVKAAEQNLLYIIFSPHAFIKANDSERELPLDEFQRWLANNRTRDKDMKTEVKMLTITK
jgi:hypothetical protein